MFIAEASGVFKAPMLPSRAPVDTPKDSTTSAPPENGERVNKYGPRSLRALSDIAPDVNSSLHGKIQQRQR